MFRTTGQFDKTLEKATSNLLMEPDWPSILQICDMIRQKDVTPKQALAAVSKKLSSPNPHTAYYALLVLESLVKNCGSGVHDELTTTHYCQTLHDLAKTTQHDNVKQKLLELIQAWTFAFRKNSKYGALRDTMNIMKTEGYKFPALRESDAMFSADTAPEWADGEVCHRCRAPFGLVHRKHHCRACGQVFCHQCSQKTTTLPKFGIEKEVRVCDACYDQFTKPTQATKAAAEKQESDLPLEYLNSSLAQQNQTPQRKSEEELREEEELQLAIALSQSEAEAKEKEKNKTGSFIPTTVKEPRPVERSPSPVDEPVNPELARYLNRTYWENRQSDTTNDTNRPTSPSAPATAPIQNNEIKYRENGVTDTEMDEFVNTLKSQVEIFINRMKSNSSRGRSIANDSSVQTLFMNITAMHSRLLRYIQQHDDNRLHYERLQDKLTQVKDARAALDALREEHREKLRRQAEEAERQRQLQMAHKLDIMRKKKQEYLQYQRQLALQRIQEQEREMQMRQEQQKQQYLMGPQYNSFIGSPVHGQQFPPNSAPPAFHNYQYGQTMMGGPQPHMMPPQVPPQSAPPQMASIQGGMPQMHMQAPPGFPAGPPQGPPQNQGMQTQHMSPPNIPPHPIGSQQMMGQMPLGIPQQNPAMLQQNSNMPQQNQGIPQQNPGIRQQNAGIPQQNPGIQHQNAGIPQQNIGIPHSNSGIPQQNIPPQQFQQPTVPINNPPVQQQPQQHNDGAQTAELISFD